MARRKSFRAAVVPVAATPDLILLLLDATGAGSEAAENTLCEVCRPSLVALIANWFGGKTSPIADEEDLADDVLAAICVRLRGRAFPDVASDADFERILRSIAWCAFLSHCRTTRCQKRPQHAISLDSESCPTAQLAIEEEFPLFEGEEELREIVYRTQDEKMFAVYLLLECGCNSPQEIAKVLNWNPRKAQREKRALLEAWRKRALFGQDACGPRPESFYSTPLPEQIARRKASRADASPPPPNATRRAYTVTSGE
jgi:DNA-directed RNA polymerase specialized sigma24 family protein